MRVTSASKNAASPAHTPPTWPSAGMRVMRWTGGAAPTAAPQKRQNAEPSSSSLKQRAQVMVVSPHQIYTENSTTPVSAAESLEEAFHPPLDLVAEPALGRGCRVDSEPRCRNRPAESCRQHHSVAFARESDQVGSCLLRQFFRERKVGHPVEGLRIHVQRDRPDDVR